MKTSLTTIVIPAIKSAKEIETDIRFEFPNINSLNVTNGGKKILISWKAIRYKKDEVEQFLSTLN